MTSHTFMEHQPQQTSDHHRDSTLAVFTADCNKETKPTPVKRERFADNGDDISYYDLDTRIGDEVRKVDVMEVTSITVSTKEQSSPFKT